MSEGTALLVIDMQVGLVAGAYRAGEVLGTIATLLAKARSSGTTVIYLQHESDEFEPLKRGTPTWQIHPDIAPAEGESVISKRASRACEPGPPPSVTAEATVGRQPAFGRSSISLPDDR